VGYRLTVPLLGSWADTLAEKYHEKDKAQWTKSKVKPSNRRKIGGAEREGSMQFKLLLIDPAYLLDTA